MEHKGTVKIETSRLILRKFTVEDITEKKTASRLSFFS